MAENAEDDIVEGEGTSSKKLPIIPGLLKWIVIGIAAVILIVTVVVITTSIISNNNAGPGRTAVTTENDIVMHKEVLDWYQSLGVIRTKTSDAIPASVVVDVVLGYKKEDKATSTEISQRTIELKDYLRRFFSEKKADELKPTDEEMLKIELRNSINDSILSSSKIKDVRFMQLDVIPQ